MIQILGRFQVLDSEISQHLKVWHINRDAQIDHRGKKTKAAWDRARSLQANDESLHAAIRDDCRSSPSVARTPSQPSILSDRTDSFRLTFDAPALRFSKMIGTSPIRAIRRATSRPVR